MTPQEELELLQLEEEELKLKLQLAQAQQQQPNMSVGQPAIQAQQKRQFMWDDTPEAHANNRAILADLVKPRNLLGMTAAAANQASMGLANAPGLFDKHLTPESIGQMDENKLAQFGFRTRQDALDYISRNSQQRKFAAQMREEHPIATVAGGMISPTKGSGLAKAGLRNLLTRAGAKELGANAIVGAGEGVFMGGNNDLDGDYTLSEAFEDAAYGAGGRVAGEVGGAALGSFARFLKGSIGRPGSYVPAINNQPEQLGRIPRGTDPDILRRPTKVPSTITVPTGADVGHGKLGQIYMEAVEGAKRDWAASTGALGAPNSDIRNQVRTLIQIAEAETGSVKGALKQVERRIAETQKGENFINAMKAFEEVKQEMVEDAAQKLANWQKPHARGVADVPTRWEEASSLKSVAKDTAQAIKPLLAQYAAQHIPYAQVKAVARRGNLVLQAKGLMVLKAVVDQPWLYGRFGDGIARAYITDGLEGAIKERHTMLQTDPEFREFERELMNELSGEGIDE